MKLTTFVVGVISAVSARRTFIYVDEWSAQSEANLITYYSNLVNAGATDIMNSFMVPNCPCGAPDLADSVGDWQRMSASGRQQVLDLVHSKGGMFHLVTGGGTYNQQYLNYTPKDFTDYVCGHAQAYGYDGVDFDLEHLPAGFGTSSSTVSWAIEASKLCRNYVGHITHAPQSPYMGTWGSFGYEAILPHVDKMLIQYYNQGTSANHDQYQNLFISDIHQAAVSEIWARNPDYKDKLVLGKYMYSSHGGSGMMSSSAIAATLEKAESELGYNGGIMIWKCPDSWDTSNLQQFLSTDLPRISAGGNNGVTPPTAPTTTTTQPITTTTTRPAVVVPPPVVAPTTTTAPARTTTTTRYTPPTTTTTPRPPVIGGGGNNNGGSAVEVCQAAIGNPSNRVWNEDCHNLCNVYATLLTAHCPGGASDGDKLALCILRLHPAQCFAV